MPFATHLNRSLGLRLVVVIVIGNIIGSGIYKKVAPMAAELQSPGWVLLCWVFAGIISLFGALSNAEVAGMLADTGGEYAYYKTIYNRFFSFIFGWSLFTIIQTAAISSLAYVFAQSLNGLYSHWPCVLSFFGSPYKIHSHCAYCFSYLDQYERNKNRGHLQYNYFIACVYRCSSHYCFWIRK